MIEKIKASLSGQRFLEERKQEIEAAKKAATHVIHEPFKEIERVTQKKRYAKLTADAYRKAEQWISPEKFKNYITNTVFTSEKDFVMETEDGNKIEISKGKDAADVQREEKEKAEHKNWAEDLYKKNPALEKFAGKAVGYIGMMTLGQNQALMMRG